MKRVVFILITILLIVALPATIYLVSKNQELRKRAAPATTLALVPNSLSKAVGDEFTLDVRMDTALNQIIAVQLKITYDATKLEAEWIHNGTMFPNILSSGTVQNGVVSIALGATNTTTPITGTGTVATLKFKALAPTTGAVSIKFDQQETFVGALNEGSTNALQSSIPATVTITSGSNTIIDVTPTPTATGSATITPTLTPAQESTNSASPSAVTIDSPLKNERVSTTLPTVEGKAPPGSTVTIVIHSTQEITATVVADANGNWTYTVAQPLDAGPHTINVLAQDTTGQTHTATLAFVVSNGTENGASGSAIPTSGAVENTIMMVGISLFLIILGSIIPMYYKFSL